MELSTSTARRHAPDAPSRATPGAPTAGPAGPSTCGTGAPITRSPRRNGAWSWRCAGSRSRTWKWPDQRASGPAGTSTAAGSPNPMRLPTASPPVPTKRLGHMLTPRTDTRVERARATDSDRPNTHRIDPGRAVRYKFPDQGRRFLGTKTGPRVSAREPAKTPKAVSETEGRVAMIRSRSDNPPPPPARSARSGTECFPTDGDLTRTERDTSQDLDLDATGLLNAGSDGVDL